MSSLAQRGSFDFDEHLPEMPLLEFENLTDLILFGFLDCILKTVASPLKGAQIMERRSSYFIYLISEH